MGLRLGFFYVVVYGFFWWFYIVGLSYGSFGEVGVEV